MLCKRCEKGQMLLLDGKWHCPDCHFVYELFRSLPSYPDLVKQNEELKKLVEQLQIKINSNPVQCMECQAILKGYDAPKHTKSSGHNSWVLL